MQILTKQAEEKGGSRWSRPHWLHLLQRAATRAFAMGNTQWEPAITDTGSYASMSQASVPYTKYSYP